MKIWKIAQIKSDISIDITKYAKSAQERIDTYITYAYEENQRLTGYRFNPEMVINTFRSVGYPNISNIEQLIQSKDFSQAHEILMDVFEWYKKQKDHNLWSKISPAIKSINDYEVVLDGNKIIWTEEFGQKKLQELIAQTEANMKKIEESINVAIERIPQWNSSSIHIVANELYKDNALEPAMDAIIGVGDSEAWGGVPNFTYFVVESGIQIDDVLESGDDDFFTNNNTQSDYFNLINSLRNPNAFSQPKVLSLYTARPSKDREIYTDAKMVPSNIFLTSKYDFAEGFAREYGGDRDVWRIKILDRYLVKTMDAPDQKQYQAVGDKGVPIISIQLITPWEHIR